MDSKEMTDRSSTFNVPPPDYTQSIQKLESNFSPPESDQSNAGQPQQLCQPQVFNVQAAQSNGEILGPYPTRMRCPRCQNEIVTQTSTKWSCCQYFVCCCMLITGICTICSCLPCCLTNYSHIKHKCPLCKTHLGTFLR